MVHLLYLSYSHQYLCAMKKSRSNRSSFSGSLKFLTLGLLLFFVGSKQNANAVPLSISFQVFYDELSPYGDWIEDPNYGFIWVPHVDQSFQPYRTNGNWVMSTYGNTWISQYNWGWAPFHYGRWFFSDFYGWAWIPGYEWGPAWVNWRSGRGYYGWVPLGPQRQFYRSSRHHGYSHWVFVPRRRLLSNKLSRYYMRGNNVNVIYNQTTVINNTYVHNNIRYNSGPSRSELRQVTRKNVPVLTVTQGRRPGRASVNSNSISLYRPQVSARSSSRSGLSSRPKKYVNAREYSKTRSTLASPSNRGTSTATSPRSNNVRSETLRNSNTPASRSQRSTTDANRSNATRQSGVSPSNSSRSNTSVGTSNSRSRSSNASTNRNEVFQQRTTPSSSNNNTRRVTPNYQQNRRTTSPNQRTNGVTNQQRVKKQSAPTQRSNVRSTPNRSNSNTGRVAPSSRNNPTIKRTPQRSTNSRVKSNSSSRTQTRSTPRSSSRSSSTTSRSGRSSRGN